ncbi:Uma2 family endonuclease [Gloeobacter morelensis]|uniref:Uma2 family endonuclease n=1 Tax=Gloeobacter morelensis MG652769 TaxID=2781736 RepID=A0ABY3PH48_9CYAN|nr:Uma2 family endonuclease [Gloeobacter morelensis]UFP92877.1 Uma2 family endonuclease [Gloeobacter morelensis MG652769]
MVANAKRRGLTPQEYFEWEALQEYKHEYVDGEVFEVTGGTIPHAAIIVNLAFSLKLHLRGGPCRVFSSDAKVGISEQGPFLYPDVVVTCDERDRNAVRAIYFPSLVIEVLSPTTEAYDRGTKFRRYRRIETLSEYVLVDAERPGVDCFRRNPAGIWELHPYSEEDHEIYFASLDLRVSMAQVYEEVRFES